MVLNIWTAFRLLHGKKISHRHVRLEGLMTGWEREVVLFIRYANMGIFWVNKINRHYALYSIFEGDRSFRDYSWTLSKPSWCKSPLLASRDPTALDVSILFRTMWRKKEQEVMNVDLVQAVRHCLFVYCFVLFCFVFQFEQSSDFRRAPNLANWFPY